MYQLKVFQVVTLSNVNNKILLSLAKIKRITKVDIKSNTKITQKI